MISTAIKYRIREERFETFVRYTPERLRWSDQWNPFIEFKENSPYSTQLNFYTFEEAKLAIEKDKLRYEMLKETIYHDC